MDWITPEIAIGNCDDAVRLEGLHSVGISGILSLTGWPNSAFNRYGIDWRCVELIDGEGNDTARLHEAVWHLHELVIAKGCVLVHCMEGVSRSPLVVASYLADKAGRPFEECLGELARLRKNVLLQPGLWDLRRAFEQAIEPQERISGFTRKRALPLAPAD